ncbi:hypothetical protein [Streptomyces sp. enrichment culture]|uniref:hypothetical protein n=1 Tax=Streptomyces sp. enrichment culture TaxID=1795815 RepID=UPI003F5574D6
MGRQMALQPRRGEMGEGAAYVRGVFFVALSCGIATTVGPLLTFPGDLSLK